MSDSPFEGLAAGELLAFCHAQAAMLRMEEQRRVQVEAENAELREEVGRLRQETAEFTRKVTRRRV
jgi:hypothetical protein